MEYRNLCPDFMRTVVTLKRRDGRAWHLMGIDKRVIRYCLWRFDNALEAFESEWHSYGTQLYWLDTSLTQFAFNHTYPVKVLWKRWRALTEEQRRTITLVPTRRPVVFYSNLLSLYRSFSQDEQIVFIDNIPALMFSHNGFYLEQNEDGAPRLVPHDTHELGHFDPRRMGNCVDELGEMLVSAGMVRLFLARNPAIHGSVVNFMRLLQVVLKKKTGWNKHITCSMLEEALRLRQTTNFSLRTWVYPEDAVSQEMLYCALRSVHLTTESFGLYFHAKGKAEMMHRDGLCDSMFVARGGCLKRVTKIGFSFEEVEAYYEGRARHADIYFKCECCGKQIDQAEDRERRRREKNTRVSKKRKRAGSDIVFDIVSDTE